ncbi:MAG: hypothetical protein GF347_03370 [Candidatus Moranbacteria bacterium]|nr:hypothetical protein [Candidatus Moranbacteria bacterium]
MSKEKKKKKRKRGFLKNSLQILSKQLRLLFEKLFLTNLSVYLKKTIRSFGKSYLTDCPVLEIEVFYLFRILNEKNDIF